MKRIIVVYALDSEGRIIHLELFPLPENGDTIAVDKAVMESFAKANSMEEARTVSASAIEGLTIARLQALANLEKAKGLTPQVLQEMAIKGWIEKGCPMPDAVGSSGFYNMINPK